MKKWFFLGLVCTLMVLPMIASAEEPVAQHPTYPNAKVGGNLVYGVWQPIDNLDPHVSQLLVVAEIDKPMFDPLVYMKPGDPNIYPGLAKSWEISADAKTYTFHLRDDVKFHDGTSLNAEAVKYNFDWVWDLDNLPGLSHDVLGPYKSSTVVDEYTLRVDFEKPFGAFLPQLAQIWGVIQSPTARGKWGDEYQFHLTGTGPYMLKEYVPNDHITMVRNPEYNWGPVIFHEGPAYLDSIEVRIIPEDATRVAALEIGEIQLCQSVPSQDLERIRQNANLQLLVGPAGGIPYNTMINLQKPPLNDLALREALWYATNQELIVDTLFKGVRTPAHWPCETTMLGYDAKQDVPAFDPEKAKQILENAGWADTNGDGIREKDGQDLKIVYIIVANYGFDEFATMQQSMYRDVGFDTEIKVQAINACLDAWNKGEHNLAPGMFWWPDPSFVRSFFHSSNRGRPSNWTHFDDPEMDQLILDGEATADQSVREVVYRKIFQKVIDQKAMIPLMHKQWVGAGVANLAGISFDITGYPNFNDVHYVE